MTARPAANAALENLLAALTLEPLEDNLFRGLARAKAGSAFTAVLCSDNPWSPPR